MDMSLFAAQLFEDLPPVRYPETEAKECFIELPDGVKLYAKIHRPAMDGKWPVILMRNPYVSNEMIIDPVIGPTFAKYGYALVDVNVRGAIKSEGEWLPFKHEREDGRAVIDWIAAQQWCDGEHWHIGGILPGACAMEYSGLSASYVKDNVYFRLWGSSLSYFLPPWNVPSGNLDYMGSADDGRQPLPVSYAAG